MNPFRPIFVLVCVGAVGAGCAQSERPSAGGRGHTDVTRADEEKPPATSNTPAAPTAPATRAAARAMRITIDTTLVVKDLDAAVASVRSAIGRHGGYVGEAKSFGADRARTATFEAHVPNADLPAFRAELASLGENVSDAEKAEDVTEQRADLNARLLNGRAQEKRLLELLEKQTGSLADVLAIQREVAGVRESIERMEAQERVLEGEISLATVRIQLSMQPPPPPPPTTALGRIAHAAREGVKGAGMFVVGSVVVAATIAPTLTVLLVFSLVGWTLWRAVGQRWRRHLRSQPPVQPGGEV